MDVDCRYFKIRALSDCLRALVCNLRGGVVNWPSFSRARVFDVLDIFESVSFLLY